MGFKTGFSVAITKEADANGFVELITEMNGYFWGISQCVARGGGTYHGGQLVDLARFGADEDGAPSDGGRLARGCKGRGPQAGGRPRGDDGLKHDVGGLRGVGASGSKNGARKEVPEEKPADPDHDHSDRRGSQ